MKVRTRIKIAVLRYGGLFRLWWLVNRHRVIIFMLHGVVDDAHQRSSWSPLRPAYSARRLDAALRSLSRFYHFVSLDEAVAMLSGRSPLRPHTAVLTFDDGYRNQLEYAVPILQKHGVPATFYVATGLVDTREPYWFDRLDFALQQVSTDGRKMTVGGEDVVFSAADRRELRRSYRQLRHAAKAMDDDVAMTREIETLAEELEQESGAALADIVEQDPWSALASWEELRSLAGATLFDIGSHTVSHARLAGVSAERASRELRDSRERIRGILGVPCEHFCYPSGSYSSTTPDFVAQAGYASAVTSDVGLNGRGADPYRLRRLPFPDFDDEWEFLAAASGFNDMLASLRSLLVGR